MIEREPRIIWKAFDQYYGYGFFFDVLEKEFGITPETHKNLVSQFDKEIESYKNVADTHITKITSKTQLEIDRLRKDIDNKSLEVNMLKQKHIIDIERTKKDTEEAMEIKAQGQLGAKFR